MFLTLAILFPQLLVPSPVHTAASTSPPLLLTDGYTSSSPQLLGYEGRDTEMQSQGVGG